MIRHTKFGSDCNSLKFGKVKLHRTRPRGRHTNFESNINLSQVGGFIFCCMRYLAQEGTLKKGKDRISSVTCDTVDVGRINFFCRFLLLLLRRTCSTISANWCTVSPWSSAPEGKPDAATMPQSFAMAGVLLHLCIYAMESQQSPFSWTSICGVENCFVVG